MSSKKIKIIRAAAKLRNLNYDKLKEFYKKIPRNMRYEVKRKPV